jgi:hypothetical protein
MVIMAVLADERGWYTMGGGGGGGYKIKVQMAGTEREDNTP